MKVGELIELLSKHDPEMLVIYHGEGYDDFMGHAEVVAVEPVNSSYKDYNEAGEYQRRGGHEPTGPAVNALFIA